MAVITSKETVAPQLVQYVDYLEGTGTQYIDTGYTPANLTAMEIKFQPTVSVGAGGIAWCETSYPKNMYGVDMSGLLYGTQHNSTYTPAVSADTVIRIQDGVFYVDGAAYWTPTAEVFTAGSSLTLFAANTTAGAAQLFTGRIYYLKLWDKSGTLVRDLRPCYDPDGVACMYDKVEKKYYYNTGTGEFAAGVAV